MLLLVITRIPAIPLLAVRSMQGGLLSTLGVNKEAGPVEILPSILKHCSNILTQHIMSSFDTPLCISEKLMTLKIIG